VYLYSIAKSFNLLTSFLILFRGVHDLKIGFYKTTKVKTKQKAYGLCRYENPRIFYPVLFIAKRYKQLSLTKLFKMLIFDLILELLSSSATDSDIDDKKPLKEKIFGFTFLLISILSLIYIISKLKEINNLNNTLEYMTIGLISSILFSVFLFFIMVKTKIIKQIDINSFIAIICGLITSMFVVFIIANNFFNFI